MRFAASAKSPGLIARIGLSLAVLPALTAVVAAPQDSAEQRAAIANDPPFEAQCLTLTDIPAPAGRSRALFNGRDLSGWSAWLGYPDPARTYLPAPGQSPIGAGGTADSAFGVRQIDGAPALWVEGRTWGSLVHRDDLSAYHLRLEYRWGDHVYAPRLDLPANNGLLYHTHGAPGAVFGTWRRAVEFEIMRHSVGMTVPVGDTIRVGTQIAHDPALIYPLRRFMAGGRPVDVTTSNPAWNVEAARDVEKEAGLWNTLDLYVVGDKAIHVVNGVPVMEVRDLAEIDPETKRRQPLTHGAIQLQSEGAETYFRNIVATPIRRLPRIAVGAPGDCR